MRTLAVITCFLLSIFVLSNSQNIHAQTIIAGRLLGYDGRPMHKAHVHVLRPYEPSSIASVVVESDGSFRITTQEQGFILVQFTGVDHLSEQLPLYITRALNVKVNARLKLNDYVSDFSSLKIVGSFNNFSSRSAQSMQRQIDGTYVAEFDTQEKVFAYQLLGLRGTGGTINGTLSEDYEYDGGGDYRSVVTPTNGHVRIVFDPRKLVTVSSTAKIDLVNASSRVRRIARIYEDMLARRKAFSKEFSAHKKLGRVSSEFKFDWSPYLAEVSHQILNERDPVIKQLLLISYLDLGYGAFGAKLNSTFARQALSEIAPTSSFWSIEPDLLGVALKNAGTPDAYDSYVGIIMERHPDQRLRNLAKKEYAPTRNIRVGQPVPDFAIVSLDDRAYTITKRSLLGKVYLIDFWATWCAPCIDEMENLHRVHETFKGKGFEIVSLSLDDKPETIQQFRRTKWPMPWLNSFAAGGYENETIKRFEIYGIPKPILVNGEGIIVATGNDLRGANLRKTLADLMKNN